MFSGVIVCVGVILFRRWVWDRKCCGWEVGLLYIGFYFRVSGGWRVFEKVLGDIFRFFVSGEFLF